MLAVATALLAGAQVLVGKSAIEALIKVNGGTSSVTSALTPFLFMALLGAVTGVLTVVANQLERLLGERAQRLTMRDVINVCIGLDLEAYDDPAFFDQLQRVMMNAVPSPPAWPKG